MGLRAQVRTRDGWAVQHAVVTVTDMTGTQVLRAAADENGAVRTDDLLQAGAYTVIVTAVGYAPAASTALVTASGRVEAGTVVLARQGGVELPPPGTWSLDPVHSSVAAVAQHLGISSVHGRFTEFGGRIEIAEDVQHSRVEAFISSTSIDTGNGMRDKHLRSADFLDVEVFPEITYRSRALTPRDPTAGRSTACSPCTASHGTSTSTSATWAPAPTRGAAYARPSTPLPSCAATTSP